MTPSGLKSFFSKRGLRIRSFHAPIPNYWKPTHVIETGDPLALKRFLSTFVVGNPIFRSPKKKLRRLIGAILVKTNMNLPLEGLLSPYLYMALEKI
jgi:hypothetical protein